MVRLSKRILRWYQRIADTEQPKPNTSSWWQWNHSPYTIHDYRKTAGVIDCHALQAAYFAAEWQSRLSQNQLKKLESIVARSREGYAIYHFAKYVKGANVKRLAKAIEDASLDLLIKFERDISFKREGDREHFKNWISLRTIFDA